jgi:hypothetical protein
MFPVIASAQDYSFTMWPYGGTFSSASGACQQAASSVNSASITGHPVSNQWNCTTDRFSDHAQDTIYVVLHGDTCPLGKTFNEQLGSCDEPVQDKCSTLKDTKTPFTFNSSSDMPPQTVNVDGCSAKVTQATCSYVSAGKASCRGTASYSGDKGPANSFGDVAACSGECPEPSVPAEKKNQDCVYVTNGNGISSCTAENYQSSPGKAQCGDVNGTYTCIENPKATSTKTTTSSTKTPTSHSDGTMTVVKDDVVTQITCKGKTCTSTTSNSSGSVTTNSNGQVTGGSSSCTGPNCSSSGVADGSGKADEGKDDEGDDGDSPTAGVLKDPTNGSFEGQGDDWDKKIVDSKKALKDGLDKLKSNFKPMGDVSLNGGSKLYCPPPVTVLDHQFDICIDKYADSLSWISDAILALCAMIALLIVFS